MSVSPPLVLGCNVPTVNDFHLYYSLSKDAVKPEPPQSRPLSIVSRRAFGVYPSNDADRTVNALRFETQLADAPALSHLTVRGEGAGHMISATTGDPELEFGFISLPCQPDCPISCAMKPDPDMYQTIGRAGESSVKFVTIDGFVQLRDFADCTLRVWSLSPDDDMTRWTEQQFLCLGSLIEQDEFKKAGLPTDMVPVYPSLSAEEEDVVYLMLGKYKKCCYAHKRSMSKDRCDGYIPSASKLQYHLRVDMRCGVLLASARLPDQTSPSAFVASTSVVPTTAVIDRKKKRRHVDRKKKRRRGDANYNKDDGCAFSQ